MPILDQSHYQPNPGGFVFLVAGRDDGVPDPATADERHDEDISDLCAFV